MSDRIEILKNSVNNAIRAICPERAILWTEYYKNKLNRNKPVEIQAAEAMCYVLQNKSIEIYPDELVVGNYTSHRVGGIIYPEKAGLSASIGRINAVIDSCAEGPWRSFAAFFGGIRSL